MTNVVGILVSLVFVFLVIGLSTLLTKLNILKDEGSRKFIHIVVSNWWIIAIMFFDNPIYASIVPLLFIIVNYISYKKQVFKAMERDGGLKDLGTVYYAISLFILSLTTFKGSHTPYIGLIGILSMGYGDGFAAVVGTRYGKHEFKVLGYKKSLEGTITMFFMCSTLSYIIMMILGITNSFWMSVIMGLVATAAEILTPMGFDNITVPLITSGFFYYLTKGLTIWW